MSSLIFLGKASIFIVMYTELGLEGSQLFVVKSTSKFGDGWSNDFLEFA